MVLFVGAARSAAGQAAGPEIFREVSVEPLGRIALGRVFIGDRAIERVGENLYQLPAGFGDTKAILVQVDSSAIVQALYFVYEDGKDFEATGADYTFALGAPVHRSEADSAGIRIRRLRWEDPRTIFEVIEHGSSGDGSAVFAVLRDR